LTKSDILTMISLIVIPIIITYSISGIKRIYKYIKNIEALKEKLICISIIISTIIIGLNIRSKAPFVEGFIYTIAILFILTIMSEFIKGGKDEKTKEIK